MKLPDRQEVERKLELLIGGAVSREAASDWARPFIVEEGGPSDVSDEGAWAAIEKIGMADLPTSDRPYLYGIEDFKAWLDELRGAGS